MLFLWDTSIGVEGVDSCKTEENGGTKKWLGVDTWLWIGLGSLVIGENSGSQVDLGLGADSIGLWVDSL